MKETDNDKAPFFKSWKGWYFSLLLFLLLLIVVFYLFTKRFA